MRDYELKRQSDNDPWWVMPLYKFGVPAGIALFLVWFLTNSIDGSLKAQATLLQSHVEDMKQEQISNRFYLLAICLNTSQTESDRTACLSAPDFVPGRVLPRNQIK